MCLVSFGYLRRLKSNLRSISKKLSACELIYTQAQSKDDMCCFLCYLRYPGQSRHHDEDSEFWTFEKTKKDLKIFEETGIAKDQRQEHMWSCEVFFGHSETREADILIKRASLGHVKRWSKILRYSSKQKQAEEPRKGTCLLCSVYFGNPEARKQIFGSAFRILNTEEVIWKIWAQRCPGDDVYSGAAKKNIRSSLCDFEHPEAKAHIVLSMDPLDIRRGQELILKYLRRKIRAPDLREENIHVRLNDLSIQARDIHGHSLPYFWTFVKIAGLRYRNRKKAAWELIYVNSGA